VKEPVQESQEQEQAWVSCGSFRQPQEQVQESHEQPQGPQEPVQEHASVSYGGPAYPPSVLGEHLLSLCLAPI
jgi:hypothetical protein